MKILAPDWVKYAVDDDEKLFIAFAWLMAKEVGLKYRYYMHVGDVTTFFSKHTYAHMGKIKQLRSVGRWLNFGKVNTVLYSFNFLVSEVREVEIEITNPKLIAIWMYILSKKQDNALLQEKQLGIHQRWLRTKLPMDIQKWLKER